MAAAQEKAKYFCENCGSEVGAKSRFCPKCGKFFSSVRCPQCGFTGDARTFRGGCPKCHYAMPSSELYGTGEAEVPKKLSRESKRKIRKAFSEQKKKEGAGVSSSDDVPRWLYVLSLIVLALIIVVLVIRCRS